MNIKLLMMITGAMVLSDVGFAMNNRLMGLPATPRSNVVPLAVLGFGGASSLLPFSSADPVARNLFGSPAGSSASSSSATPARGASADVDIANGDVTALKNNPSDAFKDKIEAGHKQPVYTYNARNDVIEYLRDKIRILSKKIDLLSDSLIVMQQEIEADKTRTPIQPIELAKLKGLLTAK